MTYKIEITVGDQRFILACVLGCVRRAQEQMPKAKAIQQTEAAAGVITRMNECRMSTLDVMFINTCIEKTRELVLKDQTLPWEQKAAVRSEGEKIQNKLAGVGVARSIFRE